MTQDNSQHRIEEERQREREEDRGPGGGAVMRIIVPLQGVVQGRGGFVLGSVIPCALFYFLQLYLRRHRSPPQSPTSQRPAIQETRLSRTQSSGRSPARPAFVSSRAVAVTEGEDSPYYMGWKEYENNPYHPRDNPSGVIQMGLAENQLSLDLVEDWLASHPEGSSWEATGDMPLSLREIARYQDYDGIPALKTAMAGFMGEVMRRRVFFNPSQIVLTAGATAAIEILSFCLADPGNAFLVPSPYYPGFDRDIKWRTGVELVPVPCRSTDNFYVSYSALERAFKQTKKRGITVRALLISNPSNPVGNTLDSDTLFTLLEFAREKNIHFISDEIYAGSVYASPQFTSVAEVVDSGNFDKSKVHIIYGISKDLGLPGFRVGVLYSYNDKVLAAARKLARFCSISSQTQRLLIAMLSDVNFIQKYMGENQRRLGKRYCAFVDGLRRAGIKCANSNAGLYCWVEMADLMPSYNEKGEISFWRRLLKEGLNVTPGSACHCIEPGWFRCCFATLSDDDLAVALQRFQKVSESSKVRT
eukprot:Gb_22779 [translate_table: standard]